ncbi:hypothetical protein A2966_02930 [Candidatus Roizmanbacteria bacterium RIFCSPLOWO2_01_FULL_41_22]|uniref:Uncharacterized protein n=1 Tax=Candidatus Roizmanbacteria bacterium RIFCSPLOWO2_01_FULL_41_22 TaxID=1802067 RepID=A0A1F7J7J7_9BACT|nr:MAG: hypothetical protein A2966_02930 [Candidatus Roizmanbacteria bacterium RIFCSPLOWO2_01_FULL_41_22]
MDLDNRNKKIALTVIQLEMFLQTLLCVVNFAVKHQKTDLIKQLKKMVDDFPASLDKQQQAELQKSVDEMVDRKTHELIKEMEKEFPNQDVKKILSQLVSPS